MQCSHLRKQSRRITLARTCCVAATGEPRRDHHSPSQNRGSSAEQPAFVCGRGFAFRGAAPGRAVLGPLLSLIHRAERHWMNHPLPWGCCVWGAATSAGQSQPSLSHQPGAFTNWGTVMVTCFGSFIRNPDCFSKTQDVQRAAEPLSFLLPEKLMR